MRCIGNEKAGELPPFSQRPSVSCATPAGVVLTAAPTTFIQAAVVGVFNVPIVADTQFAQQSLDHDQLRSGPQICDFHDGLTATAKEEGESVASSSGGEVSLHPTRGQFRSLGHTGHQTFGLGTPGTA